MCEWQDIYFRYAEGKIRIGARVIRDACDIIWKRAQNRQTITYADLMNLLKDRGHEKINRGTIGHIVGEVSSRIAQFTNPSIYPSAIVVRKDTNQPGRDFWGLDTGNNPPSQVAPDQRAQMLQKYQSEIFSMSWSCNC